MLIVDLLKIVIEKESLTEMWGFLFGGIYEQKIYRKRMDRVPEENR